MCGIVGVAFGRSGRRVTVEDLRRMAATIHHRGPDDEGFHDGGPMVFGMRRLSIIDLAGGHQPIPNEDETVWAVCNGEIYNFQQLRAGLEQRGHRFRTHSDTEVLVHLYEEHGDALVHHLAGMYGFAIWDAKRQRLLVARDRLGQKPVYYAEEGGRLAFASEVKPLLAMPGMRTEVDGTALREYLALGYAVAPATIFRGVRKLPPATYLTWEDGRVRTERYWSLPTDVERGVDVAEWADRVQAELRRAVREHLVSDVPLGAFLSGGLDSSAVVALMAEGASAPVNTYSIGYDAAAGGGKYFNELPYAAEVARAFGTNHHEILVSPNLGALLPRLMWHIEEPICDSASVTTWLVSDLAAQTVKVILSGVGGDELFAGYRRYLGGHYEQAYERLPSWIRQGVVAPLVSMLPSGRRNKLLDFGRYAKRFVQASGLPWHQQYRLYIEVAARAQVDALVRAPGAGADGFDRVAGEERAEDLLLRLMRLDAATQLPEDLLLLTDKITMGRSIECRVPFLDHRLAELAARIPDDVKLQGGELKRVLKHSLQGVLPDSILNRSKRGFGAPMGEWFKRELRPLRDVLLSQRAVESRGLLQWPSVREAMRLHDAEREDCTDLLIVLANLEIWSRLFLDGRSPEDVGAELGELTAATAAGGAA